MKKFLFALCGLLFTFNANAGQMANVEYIHQLIKQEHNIDIKYSPDLISPRQAANMKYLLTAVDVANEILNGKKTTDYGNGEFATRVAVDTTATIQAVRTLIKQDYKFFITTTPDTTEFSFKIQASGEFVVDWGDGKTEKIVKNDTSNQTYSHTYTTANEYTIKMGGKATGYTTGAPHPSSSFSTIYFPTASNITKIDGSLGEIFGTLPDGTNPIFLFTFQNAKFTTIPETLFHGITTESKSQFAYFNMFGGSELTTIPEKLFAHTNRFSFQGMFGGCTKLTSIPENLFAGINAPAEYMFWQTFYGCSGLTGSIPENLFAGISGVPAEYMFYSTFYGCSGLSGSIPENLFAGIEGTPATGMFLQTFYGCSGLTGSIPENLFAGIKGAPASRMFENTFSSCSGLTGYIPPKLFAGIGTDTTASYQMSNVFSGTGLDTTCPAGTEQYMTGFESWFSGRVSCEPFVFEPKFTATTTPDTTTFSFAIQASGEFFVDWGDGAVEQIVKNDTSQQTYSHTYDTPDEYTINMGGQATGYTTTAYYPSTSFSTLYFPTASNIAKIDGSLGEIFGTLPDGTNPIFSYTFENAKFTTIPETLFHGITTESKSHYAYYGMFRDSELTTIPEKLFAHTNRFSFQGMFSGCTKLTSIPENLFASITGAPAEYMFYGTFGACSGLTGSIPENLFAGIKGAPAEGMFYSTFSGCSGLTGNIPENLFAGVSGAPASEMFLSTFSGCSGLSGNIPENLFAGIKGAPASYMFHHTFNGCSGLTGSIPKNLFAGITGAPAYHMFSHTFEGCSGLTGYIPPELFAGIDTDTTAIDQMSSVFSGTGLDTVCPSGTVQYTTGFESWFDGRVSCEPFVFTATTTSNTTTFSFDISAKGRFLVDWGDGSDVQVITRTSTSNKTYTHKYATAGEYQIKIDGKATGYGNYAAISFYKNQNLAKIDGSLGMIFSTLSDGTQPRFGSSSNWHGTFQGCTNLTGEIPAELFSGISGAPIEYMFYNTFYDCSGLSGNIPENLFAGINGAPAGRMFRCTFNDCSGLSGSIPENLFAGIKGAPAKEMFFGTFDGCSGLTGSIQENLFAGIKGAPAEGMFSYTFRLCSGLTGYIPPKLFAGIGTDTTATNQMSEVFWKTGLDTTCPAGTIQYTTGFESWFDGRVSCEPYVPNATLTTTTNPGRFMIRMTAIGNFTIDWGDGNVEKITRHDTNDTEYWHDYGNADQSYSIKITGRATGYSDDPYRAAISFRENTQLAYVNGELGEIFPTLDDGTQPGFYETFYGCTGMKEISPTLFAGISGAPRARMFGSTFRKCSSLTEIPADLFANITGNPAANVFDATFQECSNLTTIPENLFGGIYGTPAPEMFMRTFHNCSGLTSIPENLFGNISGTSANNMFNNMFEGCSNLTGYSARINGEFLYNIWPNIQTWAYVGCNKLTDYSTMPNSWK